MQCVPHSALDGTAAVWDTLNSLERAGNWIASERVALAYARRLEARPSTDSLGLSRALLHIANGQIKRRHYIGGEAFATLDRSLALRARHIPGSDPLQSWAHVLACVACWEADQPSRGIPHGEAALRMLGETLPPDTLLLAQAHFGLGLCLGRSGHADEANAHFEKALALDEAAEGPSGWSLVAILGEYALHRARNNDYERGEALLLRAQAIAEREESTAPTLLESALARRSTFADRLGNTPESLDLAERSYELIRRRLGENSVEALGVERNIANRLADKIGDYRSAAALYRHVVAGWDTMMGPGNFSTMNTRLGLIHSLVQIGDTASAARELAVARAALETHPEVVARTTVYLLQDVADLENARGRSAVARDSLRRAIQIEWDAGGQSGATRGILYQHWMTTLNGSDDRQGYDEATRDIARLTDSTWVRQTWTWPPLVAEWAAAEARLGLHDQAWKRALESEQTAREGLMNMVQALPEAYLLQHAAHLRQPCDLLVALARPRHEAELRTAWDRIIDWRGLVRHEITRRRLPTAASDDTALVGMHARWIAAQRQLGRLVVSGAASPDDPETANLYHSARQAADAAEYRFHQAASSTMPREDSVSLDRVLEHLEPTHALVAFATGSIGPGTETLGAFVATGAERRPRWVALGPSAEVTDEIREWVRQLAAPPSSDAIAARSEATCRRLGARVRTRIWDPIAKAVGPALRVYIVPEGAATEIPWLALPGPNGRYLADGPITFHVIDAERDLLASPRGTTGTGILAVGAPDFDRAGTPAVLAVTSSGPATRAARLWPCGGAEPFSLSPLPGSRSEVEAVAREWPASGGAARVLIGADADEASVKRLAPGHAVLHLATHGIVVNDACGPTTLGTRGVGGVGALVPSPRAPAGRRPGREATGPEPSAWRERQVWLALAGANDASSEARGADEGLLTAEEIVTLDLRGTDWVVLSACHSGFASEWGREGVLGMRRAFRLAGARSVIASAWAVGDESTREWMIRLYAARARGDAAGPAVEQACRAALAARRKDGRSTHPFYWAAFTASGE